MLRLSDAKQFVYKKVDIESTCLKIIALLGINVLAGVYDSQWLLIAVGADLITLGYSLRQIKNGEKI